MPVRHARRSSGGRQAGTLVLRGRAIAHRLPPWILPDELTALGVLSAISICAAYVLSNENSAWLWVVSGLLVVHRLGDSLAGTLARVRRIQRPRYGYYLDWSASASPA